MRLSVIQMEPGHDKQQNLLQATALLQSAISADKPELVALPEVWTCLGGDAAAKRAAAESLPAAGSGAPGGPAYELLRGVARQHRICVHGGSIGEQGPGGKLYNTTVVFDPDGQEIARYRKIHLFDIVTPDGAGYRESATFAAGREMVTFAIGPVTVGLAICYDIRFAELFIALRRAGADLIVLPAAFTLLTGKDHWETLIRARAIETQCWFAAPATHGRHLDASGLARFTYGHSLICDPWGHVVARASDGAGWASARLDPAATARVRRDMPVMQHRVVIKDAAQGEPAPERRALEHADQA